MSIRLTTKQAAALGLRQKPAKPRKGVAPIVDSPRPAEARTVRLVVPMLPPTVNHMYVNNGRGGKVLGAGALAFRQAVADAAEGLAVGAGDLALTVRLTFPDRRKSDLDNRLKACQDALALALGFDDAHIVRLVVERAGVAPKQPVCEMVLEVLE